MQIITKFAITLRSQLCVSVTSQWRPAEPQCQRRHSDVRPSKMPSRRRRIVGVATARWLSRLTECGPSGSGESAAAEGGGGVSRDGDTRDVPRGASTDTDTARRHDM